MYVCNDHRATVLNGASYAFYNAAVFRNVCLFCIFFSLLCTRCNTGYVVVLPCIDRWMKVDLRMKAFSVPPQKVRLIGID